jgi:hypothetical protein
MVWYGMVGGMQVQKVKAVSQKASLPLHAPRVLTALTALTALATLAALITALGAYRHPLTVHSLYPPDPHLLSTRLLPPLSLLRLLRLQQM